MTCTPIKFGTNNHVPFATLSATPAPVTDINFLKNEYKASLAKWIDPTQDIVITGTLPESKYAEYFALPSTHLTGLASVKMEFFAGSDASSEYTGGTLDAIPLADLIPLGKWRAGIDPYGVPRLVDKPDLFLYFLEKPVICKTFRLTISHSEFAATQVDNVLLRMLLIGNKIELEKNFSYGSAIKFLTDPELVETSGGSSLAARKQRKRRVLALSLPMMTPADRELMWQFESQLDGAPFLVSAYPSATGWQYNNYSFLARFGSSLSYSHDYSEIHSVDSMILVEA